LPSNTAINIGSRQAKAEKLIEVIKENLFQNRPPYEKLVGDLSGAFSRRINIQHGLIY
jgi:Txe/YoeB family toxin of toxin-antitoxin system